MIAVILVRGTIGASQKVVDTLGMMRLKRKNVCIVIENTRSNMGMIQKVKDYITWGEVDETTVKSLIEKRSEKNPDNPSRTKPYFRLNAPRKGFGRKGIKVFFNKRGALGYRGEKINDLIMRML
ncbi:50S ribosomal protein L30 [Candidatus Woesearchaeota archaeon CG10_big_fil_rev_8_21_14_0_10_44_13]|nr:MAG: 50S ribosomal protein L30 [Candidatus Woesearchaeota archaeon CG10_big_fil_rev_8_21_14_0_10_44_13]